MQNVERRKEKAISVKAAKSLTQRTQSSHSQTAPQGYAGETKFRVKYHVIPGGDPESRKEELL